MLYSPKLPVSTMQIRIPLSRALTTRTPMQHLAPVPTLSYLSFSIFPLARTIARSRSPAFIHALVYLVYIERSLDDSATFAYRRSCCRPALSAGRYRVRSDLLDIGREKESESGV